ncbi:hypothetical protein [Clostridium akagii]|uniref:hypothetical protein n=1 Tax=Clostridium akagii TaxID=91623 RepID=UPI00047ECA86|nr:hypothetical protein [Clostridium akagii]
MIVRSITNLKLFKVLDEGTNEMFYGCNQEWYGTDWQRRSGCGPSVASNIVFYLNNNKTISDAEKNVNTKNKCVSFMEEVWEHVTPTNEGIPTTKMFYDHVVAYTKSKGLNVKYGFCDVPEDKLLRPKLSKILDFLEEALIKDSPIAFLNLSNGDEKNLEPWHWVTIISLQFTENKKSAFIKILDEGLIKNINLELWYNTTTLGGGFVYLLNATS